MERLNSGELRTIFRNISCIVIIGLTKSGRKAWKEEEEKRRTCTSIVLILQEQFLYLRALQGHSGRSLIDPSLQDNVIIRDGFFKYIFHVGCAINLHSITNTGSIPGGQHLSNRQTVFFLPVDPIDKEHKDPAKIDLGSPRLAQYMHKAWKKQQNTVYWVPIERHHPLQYTPSLLYPEGYQDGNWRNHIRKSIRVTLVSSEDFVERQLDEGIGFRSCWTSRKLPTKPKSNSQNRATCYDRTNVPFECSGNRHTFLTWLREYEFVC